MTQNVVSVFNRCIYFIHPKVHFIKKQNFNFLLKKITFDTQIMIVKMEQKMKILMILLVTCIAFTHCTNDDSINNKNSKDRVESIKLDGDKTIADIIRSPVNADDPIDTVNVAKMTFDQAAYDFGFWIKEGAVIKHVYKFTNTGNVPLIISDARSTCGCTVPKWPKQAIEPGKSGQISVRFDSKGKKDRQVKPITITANTYPNQTILQIKGNVIPK